MPPESSAARRAAQDSSSAYGQAAQQRSRAFWRPPYGTGAAQRRPPLRSPLGLLPRADAKRLRSGSHCVVACRLFGPTQPRSSRLALQTGYPRRTYELFTDKLLVGRHRTGGPDRMRSPIHRSLVARERKLRRYCSGVGPLSPVPIVSRRGVRQICLASLD